MFTPLVSVWIGSSNEIMNVEGKGMLKHRFGVSWWIGIRFSQKKVTENHEI